MVPAGLGGLLGQLGGGALLDNVLGPQPTDASRGDAVLGEIFGSKDVSRTVAQDASAKTGLDPALLKRMLPMAAALMMGALARESSTTAPPSPGAAGMAGGNLMSILGATFDRNRDGSILDDVLGALGGVARK